MLNFQQKMAIEVPKVKSAPALYQKFNVSYLQYIKKCTLRPLLVLYHSTSIPVLFYLKYSQLYVNRVNECVDRDCFSTA